MMLNKSRGKIRSVSMRGARAWWEEGGGDSHPLTISKFMFCNHNQRPYWFVNNTKSQQFEVNDKIR